MSHDTVSKTTMVKRDDSHRKSRTRARLSLERLDSRLLMAVNLTGNVVADFPGDRADIAVATPDPAHFPFIQPNVQPNIANLVLVSGLELSGVRFHYDQAIDSLFIGFDQPMNQKTDQRVIIGDIDNNLNGSTIDPRISPVLDDAENFIDYPKLGGRESAGLQFDFNKDGLYDAIAGIEDSAYLAPEAAYNKTLIVADFNDPSLGGSRFGTAHPEYAGALVIGETPEKGGLEFEIKNFSKFYQAQTGQALPQTADFHILAFAGSANDGGTEEARLAAKVQLNTKAASTPTPTPAPEPTHTPTTTPEPTPTHDHPTPVPVPTPPVMSPPTPAPRPIPTPIPTPTPQPVTAKATISGCVYVDMNDSGKKEAGETALPGVSVALTNAQGVVLKTLTTDANGCYKFTNLDAGSYSVVETQPTGYFSGKNNVGSNGGELSGADKIGRINVYAGEDAMNYDFAELLRPSIAQPASGNVAVGLNNQVIQPAQAAEPLILANAHDFGQINTFRNTLVSVHILGNANFDASQVDPTLVDIDGVTPDWARIRDANKDGFQDMLVVFRSRSFNLPRGAQNLIVTGETIEGDLFQGSVRVFNQPTHQPNKGATRPPLGVVPLNAGVAAAQLRQVVTSMSHSRTPLFLKRTR